MLNLVVKSLVIGNSGEYHSLKARGYESSSDTSMLQDSIARATMDGSAISQVGNLVCTNQDVLHTSSLVGADIAVDGSLTERRNVFHMVIDDMGMGMHTGRYLVTGYVSPGSIVDGNVLPNAPFYLNNIMRLHQGPKGWSVRSNILTHMTRVEDGPSLNPFDQKKRSKVRLEDVTHRAYTCARDGGTVDEAPVIIYNADVSSDFVNQGENLASSALHHLTETYADAAQTPEALSSMEMLNSARSKLTTTDAGTIVSFLKDSAGLTNGMVHFINLQNAFNLGPHNMHIEDDGSLATVNNYSNPNSATNEAKVAYTVANNFGHCALGVGLIVAECTFTNNALYDPRYGCNFAFNMNSRPYYVCEGMDEVGTADALMMAIVREIMPHVSENFGMKVTVRVSFAAYKDIIITVDCGAGEETFVFPAFSSSGYNLTISGSTHGESTMTRLALAVNQVVGVADNIHNAPIGMSEVTSQSFAPSQPAGVGNVSMPSAQPTGQPKYTLGNQQPQATTKPKFTLG